MPKDNWVFWLNMTNIVLGAVVLLALLIVAYALAWELANRYKKSHTVADVDEELQAMLQDGRFVPGLGVTMQDGGERAKPSPNQPAEKKRS